ncbi:hypothetical protein [Methanobrevibacter sp.]|uniref:hypothetical protein n=1 Tax=Methanobrevibacter sp. TaxID=66852 RepID=UPI0038647129
MLNKNLMALTIFIICLFAVSAASAADNATNDIVSVENDIILSNDNENILDSPQSDSLAVSNNLDNLTYGEDEYEDVYVKSLNGNYGDKNIINYGWKGNLNGYFAIYNGNDMIYQKIISPDGYENHDETYGGSAIKAVGTYNAVICNEYDDLLAKTTIKINKIPTQVISSSFSAKIGSKGDIHASIFNKKENGIYETSGKAKFKIAGKTYTSKFKKGSASIRIKLPLTAKTYICTVKFLGNKNYKASSYKFKIKVSKGNVAILKKNKKVKVGKYTVKLTSKQYKAIVKSFNKNKSKNLKFKTKYKYKVKVPYTKKVKKYKTTRAVKTLYGVSYLPMINKMYDSGWTKVSEYTYNQPNPQNKNGIGLSSYTIAVCKWVKISYKTAYKTKYYPIKGHIYYHKSTTIPTIELYSYGKILNWKYMAIA